MLLYHNSIIATAEPQNNSSAQSNNPSGRSLVISSQYAKTFSSMENVSMCLHLPVEAFEKCVLPQRLEPPSAEHTVWFPIVVVFYILEGAGSTIFIRQTHRDALPIRSLGCGRSSCSTSESAAGAVLFQYREMHPTPLQIYAV
jgi:hypothetical protein